jgi:hypothetical protein
VGDRHCEAVFAEAIPLFTEETASQKPLAVTSRAEFSDFGKTIELTDCCMASIQGTVLESVTFNLQRTGAAASGIGPGAARLISIFTH